MGLAEDRAKNQAMAHRMKEQGITRTTGACPMGCGARIPNGGPALISHLGRCTGAKKSKN